MKKLTFCILSLGCAQGIVAMDAQLLTLPRTNTTFLSPQPVSRNLQKSTFTTPPATIKSLTHTNLMKKTVVLVALQQTLSNIASSVPTTTALITGTQESALELIDEPVTAKSTLSSSASTSIPTTAPSTYNEEDLGFYWR